MECGLTNSAGVADGELDGVGTGEVFAVGPLAVWLVPTVNVGVVGGVVCVRSTVAGKVGDFNGIGVERRGGESTCKDNWTRVAGAVKLS